jgi:hypothetical protein
MIFRVQFAREIMHGSTPNNDIGVHQTGRWQSYITNITQQNAAGDTMINEFAK